MSMFFATSCNDDVYFHVLLCDGMKARCPSLVDCAWMFLGDTRKGKSEG